MTTPTPRRRVLGMRLIVTSTTAALIAGAVLTVGTVSERNARQALTREIEARLLLQARNLALTSVGALLSDYPELRPDAPEQVAGLVGRMLEKDPAARITADDGARELSDLTGVPAPATDRVRTARADARRRRGLPLMLGVLALIAMGVPWLMHVQGAEQERRAVTLNNQGHDSLSAGRLDPARQHFEAALALAPRYGEAKLNLAVLLHRQGDHDRAAALYGEVIAENRRRADLLAPAHYGLGEIDLQAGAWPSAIVHLSEAVLRDSSRVEYPNNLGFALVQAGRTDQALATLRAAQARFPGEPALLKNAALAWFQAGRFDSALASASEATRLRPVYPEAWLLKERSEAALGDLAAARASLATLRTLSPDPTMLAEAETALREGASPQTR